MRFRLRTLLIFACVAAVSVGIAAFAYQALGKKSTKGNRPAKTINKPKARGQNYGNYTLWWDEIPNQVQMEGCPSVSESNIHPDNYAGPESCKKCHKTQYDLWSNHPHRWMNSLVEKTTVYGNFNNHRLAYLGGEVTFFQEADQYRMRLERGDVRREFVVEQTLGSRFFQYYIGKQLQGPEPSDHPLYSEAHVLPLGYWMDREEWVPVVHVHGEVRDKDRHDPFLPRPTPPSDFGDYADQTSDLYRSQCNFCHTTFAIGDLFLRYQQTFNRHTSTLVDVSMADYVKNARPTLWPAGRKTSEMADGDFAKILKEFYRLDATKEAVTLGVSCEACHLGAKDHAEGRLKKPRFLPTGSEVVLRAQSSNCDMGRNHDNVNYSCSRCHAGPRPQYANGTATWNSTEYTDSQRGGCYSQLTCVRCHNPHEAIGHQWSKTPAQDDTSCLSCHQKFETEQSRVAHTHHPLSSEGSHCMNCHMPRINEGLQDVVRTHTIFSPTNQLMLESNQLNACNLCHVDKPIDWTLAQLKDWYGKSFSKRKIEANYPHRDQPAAMGWLKSDNEAVRLVAADALARGNANWALPDLITALDDTFLLNRQFARMGLEKMLNVKLSDFGYQFYQTSEERAKSLKEVRSRLLPETTANTQAVQQRATE